MKHVEKIVYLIIGALIGAIITTGAAVFKERILDVPDYRLDAEIKAPVARMETWLVNEKTGEKTDLPGSPWPVNPIEVHLKNTGKKAIENLEVVLEFMSTGDFELLDEEYAHRPERGFGKINFSTPKNTERIVKLGLFNPGDEFFYFATGTRPVRAIAYARFPGLSFYLEYSPVERRFGRIRLFGISFLALSLIFGILQVFSVQRRIIKQYGIRNIKARGIINVYWNDRTKVERVLFYWGFSLALLAGIFLGMLISNT